jgi:hypothetical protein
MELAADNMESLDHAVAEHRSQLHEGALELDRVRFELRADDPRLLRFIEGEFAQHWGAHRGREPKGSGQRYSVILLLDKGPARLITRLARVLPNSRATVRCEGRVLWHRQDRLIAIVGQDRSSVAAEFRWLASKVLLSHLACSGFHHLHGACVSRGDKAIVFVGPNGAGKTSLMLWHVHRGLHFVSDNCCYVRARPGEPVEVRGFPSAIRLVPNRARVGYADQVMTRGDVLASGIDPKKTVAQHGLPSPPPLEPQRLSLIVLPRYSRGDPFAFEWLGPDEIEPELRLHCFPDRFHFQPPVVDDSAWRAQIAARVPVLRVSGDYRPAQVGAITLELMT